VLDPTLLLDKSDYKEIIYNKCIENKYIYIYSININSIDDIYWDDLKKYADRNNFSILTTPSDGYIKGEELFGQESQYSYATVEEWLGNIFYSNLVITPSFHGIALSIILEKPFIYIPLKGKYATGNNRVLDLLKDLNLNDRIKTSDNTFEEIIDSNIDWEKVSILKNKMRTVSIEYLNKNL
jgi:exopolysaccharide biosynthesis predicted pyruvyltransferase EpsI